VGRASARPSSSRWSPSRAWCHSAPAPSR